MITRCNLTLAAAAFIGLVAAIPVFTTALVDDAYIHARIAENFILSGQPAFNAGDTFKASSSTGFVLLLAGLSTLIDTILAIRLLQAAALLSIFILGAWLVRQLEGPRLFHSFILLSGVPFILLSAYGGMETSIFVGLMMGSTLAVTKGRQGLAITLIAVSVWFRFEAFLFLILALVWIGSRRLSVKPLVYTWPAVALVATELVLYGTILPHAAGAKSQAYGHSLAASIETALRFGTGATWLGVLLLAVLLAQAVRILRDRDLGGYENVLFAFSGGVLCAWMIGGSNLFTWYYPLVYTPFTIGLIVMPLASRNRIFKAIVLLVTGSYLVLGGQFALSTLGVTKPSSNLRVASYLSLGTALYLHCPSCSLVTSEIGGLGYGFKGVVYDGFGLADPEAMQFHPMRVPDERPSAGVGAIPPQYVALRDPDFVVSMPIFSQALRTSGALDMYSRYDCPFSTDGSISIWGDHRIEVYSKTPLPAEVMLQMASCRQIWPSP